ncbi:AmpG family muropeptide MFS transporter [Niveibacterium umoris]|uniref:PAT family beta-lactamase induction signal transducer AmpG n=1 Tax=Niveibacterium umoris TaxID=1193620 RepID=A0A840BNP5_9RHOO|nr:AmpG family muropeptide MFS transporter [Niveibacterium umoris]MBB4014253.1 PAT family beta-lactamase induction signal transducer AmpG [Niveibacterium umoris]
MTTTPQPSLWQTLLTRKMLICIVLGFSSGLPLFLLFNLVPAWLKTEGLSLKAIGAFALVQFPYTWKFLWAPFADRYAVPGLGRRRGWMLLSQLALIGAVVALGALNPVVDLSAVVALAALVAFLSATQDIAIDAYRRELLAETELGFGNAVFVNAYKIAGLVPGSLSLFLADHLPWFEVFAITAAFLIPGALLSLAVSEPAAAKAAPRTLRDAVVEPFHEFFNRHGWQSAALVLAFIFFYKLGDSLATALATPFYLEMGFSKTDIGIVAKNAGLWCSVAGGLLGGVWMIKLGINRALWLFGVAQAVAVLGFAWLAWIGPGSGDATHLLQLGLVIGAEAFGVGLGTTAFVAFIARTTNPAYSATQFALFTSLMAVPRTVINAFAGVLVEQMGWFNFFWLCFALALPGMWLLARVAPWRDDAA